MIVPSAGTLDLNVVASAASDRVGKEPDYEVWGPNEAVNMVTRYVTHLPRDFKLVNGIRFSSPGQGTGTIWVQVRINGTNLFTTNQPIGGATVIIPMSAVVAFYQNAVLPAGGRLELLIMSAPITGSGTTAWLGLRMALLGKTPGVSATNAGLCLPPLALWTPTLTLDPVLGAGGAPLANSYGSGITYWPEKDTLLVVDNDTNEITEMTTAGVYLRTITLTGFADVEGITYVDGFTFAVVEEDLRTICVITIPVSGPATVVKGGTNWIRTIATGIPAGAANLGLESLAYEPVTDTFLTCREKVTAGGLWDVWRVTNADVAVATVLFSLHSAAFGIATDITDIALTWQQTLLLVSHEGAPADQITTGPDDNQGRILELKLDGRIIQQTNIPRISKCEGVTPDLYSDRIFLTGEANGGTGMEFQVWHRP